MKKHNKIILSLITITAILGANTMNKQNDEVKEPEVTIELIAGVGKPVKDMLDKSKNYNIDINKYGDNATFVIEKNPTQLTLDNDDLEFTFTEGRFAWMDTQAGCITNIHINPVMTTLSLDDVFELTENLAKELQEAGWEPTTGYSEHWSYQHFKKVAPNIKSQHFASSQYYFKASHYLLRLEIKRLFKKGRHPTITRLRRFAEENNMPPPEQDIIIEEDKYILNVFIDLKDNLRADLRTIARKARQKEHNDRNKSLPLSYWIDNSPCSQARFFEPVYNEWRRRIDWD